MRRFSRIFAWTTLFFVAGAVLFFTKAAALPYKVAWPVLLLSLATFLSRRRELLPFGFAFLFSAAGDAVGARGCSFPRWPSSRWRMSPMCAGSCPGARRRLRAVSLAVTVPLLVFLFAAIVPEAPFPAERIGVAVYGLVIAAMLYSALQYDGACAAGFRCAALLFVFSDAVIAWNRFIGPVPARTWIVMTTYYLAQYLFFRFAFKTAARN